MLVESSDLPKVQGPLLTSASVNQPSQQVPQSIGEEPSITAQRESINFSTNFGFANWNVSTLTDLSHLNIGTVD